MSAEPSGKNPREVTGDLFDELRFSEQDHTRLPAPVSSSLRAGKRQPANAQPFIPQPPVIRPPSATPPGAGPDEAGHIPVDLREDEDIAGLVIDLPDSFRPRARQKPGSPWASGAEEEHGRHARQPDPREKPRSITVPGVIFTCLVIQLLTLVALSVFWSQGLIPLPPSSDGIPAGPEPAEVAALPDSAEDRFTARMEILELEDLATSRGERVAWAALKAEQAALEPADPLYVAVDASLNRIQRSLLLDRPQLEDPGPDTQDTAQLQAVLVDRKATPLQRMRAAQLLGRRTPDREILGSLLRCMEEDPNLHVLMEAGTALKECVGYSGDLLDSGEARAWIQRDDIDRLVDGGGSNP